MLGDYRPFTGNLWVIFRCCIFYNRRVSSELTNYELANSLGVRISRELSSYRVSESLPAWD